MIHRVGGEARRRIGVAVAALDSLGRDVWRRGVPGCGGAVVTVHAVGVGRRMGKCAAGPTGVTAARRAGMAGLAVGSVGCDMPGIGGGAVGALRALRGVGAVVARIAAGRGHRRMIHCIGGEARRGIAVAVAALDAGGRDVRRCRHAGRGGAVVTARAIGVGRRMRVGAAGKADIAATCRAGVAGRAILAAGGDMPGIGGGAVSTLRALRGVGAVVTGIATCRGHRRVIHRVGGEVRCGIAVAVAALDARGRNMRRRRHAGRDGAVVAI